MILRLCGPTAGLAVVALAASLLLAPIASADQSTGPGYTYFGVSYEWTDVKNGVTPRGSDRFNNGSIAGENIDLSVAILPMWHVTAQAFGFGDGTCEHCNADGTNVRDADFTSIKIGTGVNLGLDLIGLNENTDFIARVNYISTEVDKLGINADAKIDDSGWSGELMLRSRISDRTDVQVGWEYQDYGNPRNRDITVGINYRVGGGVALLARGIIFDSETSIDLGIRWYFGEGLIGRDSLIP